MNNRPIMTYDSRAIKLSIIQFSDHIWCMTLFALEEIDTLIVSLHSTHLLYKTKAFLEIIFYVHRVWRYTYIELVWIYVSAERTLL